MNFPHNRSLKELALYILAALFIIFSVEFFVIRYKIERLEEIEEKKDFARSIQIDAQEIAYLIAQNQKGADLPPEIVARLNDHDHNLQILSEGGRLPRTDIFISPLSTLPKISFTELTANWKAYRESISLLDQVNESPTPVVDSLQSDSTVHLQKTEASQKQQKITAALSAQWLTVSKWYDRLLMDLADEALEKKNAAENWVLIFISFDILLIGSLFFLFYHFVLTPVKRLKQNISNLHQENNFGNNEIGDLSTSINDILEQLTDATEFVGAIGEGKLDYDYTTLDANYQQGKNKLADSLILMQGKLKALNQEEQRRQWANEGLTRFVDILRSSDDNIFTLADKIISALVKYTNSNQGGLYTLNDEDENNKHLELISLFAFDSKKYDKRKIKLGEGILGQTFLEKETTLLTEIPEEFIRITSGLGDANPRSILVVPLKVDKEIYGVVELASFKTYQAHEIAFVEKLAETIASTLASVKVGQKNRQLIEQFQLQAEEMRAQEEEMRQNMEELEATQEELARKEQDYIARINKLEATSSKHHAEAEIQAITEELKQKESEYQIKLNNLEAKLRMKNTESDDWAIAKDLEKTFRMHLEALKITQEELRRS